MDLSESSLSCRAESILEKLVSSSTVEQVSLDIGVSGDLQEFKEALSSLKDRLLVADYRPQLHPDLLEWPWMLKQVLSDAENMLDEIHCQSSSLGGRKQKWLKPLGSSFITKVGSFFFSSSNPFVFRNPPKLATQIKELTKRVQHCAAEKFDVGTFPYDIIDKDVIGREIDKEIIIEKLLMEHHDYDSHCDDDDDESLSVLPIVGMRGLGKSTLAKIVFRDKRIRKCFSVQMWVCVSHQFDIEQIIIQMINSACFFDITYQLINKGQFKMGQLLELLESKLARKKFLLVLDNVWNEDPLKWDELRSLIPTGANGSKILLTTHSRSIASMTSNIPSHNLEPLSLKDSLSLFENFATRRVEKKYPYLIEIGRKIVNQCGGIPLAIKTLFDMIEWESMSFREFRDFSTQNSILLALKLSYHFMPFYLKQCFELFSLYPNDYVFHSSEVVSLWAALDILPSPNIDETLTDVSHQCLQELMPRCFF